MFDQILAFENGESCSRIFVEALERLELIEIEELLLGIDALFPGMRHVVVDSESEKKIRCGNPVETAEEDGPALVYGADGSLLMLGDIRNNIMSTTKSFFEV